MLFDSWHVGADPHLSAVGGRAVHDGQQGDGPSASRGG